MHLLKKKSAGKKRRRTRGDYIRMAAFIFVVGGFLYTIMSQQLQLTEIRNEIKQNEKDTAQKKVELAALEQKSEYNSSEDSYEKKARDEGYVLEGEVVFVVGN